MREVKGDFIIKCAVCTYLEVAIGFKLMASSVPELRTFKVFFKGFF